jgi:hypothetical protein
MTTTVTAEDLANVPHPGGATYVGDWDSDPNPHASRYWQGASRTVSLGQMSRRRDVQVTIAGTQHADGHSERYLEVEEVHPDLGVITDEPITPAEARAWAVALIAAADDADQMASRDSHAAAACPAPGPWCRDGRGHAREFFEADQCAGVPAPTSIWNWSRPGLISLASRIRDGSARWQFDGLAASLRSICTPNSRRATFAYICLIAAALVAVADEIE